MNVEITEQDKEIFSESIDYYTLVVNMNKKEILTLISALAELLTTDTDYEEAEYESRISVSGQRRRFNQPYSDLIGRGRIFFKVNEDD